MKYLLNRNTNFLKNENGVTYINETDRNFVVDTLLIKLIDDNCKYYGSSYNGRKISSKFLIGVTAKLPIIINERKLLIIFPINSPRRDDAIWLVYNNVLNYKKKNKFVEVTFKNGKIFVFPVSYNVFNTQILKCSRLLSVFMLRK